MTPSSDPPIYVGDVLDAGIDALLGGSAGWFAIPAGGNMNCTWLSRKRCYRLTIDVDAGRPFDDDAESFLAELRSRLERIPTRPGAVQSVSGST